MGGAITVTMLVAACAGDEPSTPTFDTDFLRELSATAVRTIGDGIGEAREARFVESAGSAAYLVLDRYGPHLRLFDRSGRPLWSGVEEGDGPRELKDPQGLAVGGRGEIVVVQQGRLSRWRLAGDSLAFEAAVPLPDWYRPLAVEAGCEADEWMLYARDNRQFLTESPEAAVQVRRMDHLHRLRTLGDDVAVDPVWAPPPGYAIYARTSHRAALLTRLDTVFVLYHRLSPGQAGAVYRLGCSGTQLWERPERPLVVGGELPVRMPQPRPMQWTNGALPIDPGTFVVAIPRWEAAPDHTIWSTELFRVTDDTVHSVLVDGQWRLYDYDVELGALMGNDDPVPHMVIVPTERLANVGGNP